MKFQSSLSVLAIAIASISAAQAQSVLSSPFGNASSTKSSIAVLTKSQAKAALGSAAAAKAESQHLDKLLDSDMNDVIVTFNASVPTALAATGLAQRLETEKSAFRAVRRDVLADLNTSDVQYLHEYNALPLAHVRVHSRAALVALLNHGGIKSVTPNLRVEPSMTESNALVHQPGALPGNFTGANTTVAVIDDGLAYNQAVFGNCTAVNTPASCRVVAAGSASGAFTSTVTTIKDGNNNSVQNGAHGTNVAAIAATVAPGTRIAAFDMYDATHSGSSATLLQGMDWAITNRTALNIVSVNISQGLPGLGKFTATCDGATGTTVALMRDAVARLRAANILPVIAAGNNGWTDGISAPACVAGAVSVGALWDATYTTSDGSPIQFGICSTASGSMRANQVACFSNVGNNMTLFAPGAYIAAGGYTMPGTSQAAPHVAGAVALLRTVAPNESLTALTARLTKTTWSATDTRGSQSRTKPRLDVLGAIANNHYTVMQQMYLAYYGRPADAGGLAFWAVALANNNGPTTLQALQTAYGTNPTVKNLIDSFATSAESALLYPAGSPTIDFVKAVYRNLFNREADSAGSAWWANEIDSGRLTRGLAAIAIANGAQGADITSIQKKTEAMTAFTTSVDTAIEIQRYTTTKATGHARTTLSQVSSATDVPTFQPTIDASIAWIVANP